MPTVEENEREFERMGLARVKVLVAANGLSLDKVSDAKQWVAQEEEKERQRRLAFEAEQRKVADEQLQIARSALKVGRSTWKAAWIAAVASIAAIVVAILLWLFPHT